MGRRRFDQGALVPAVSIGGLLVAGVLLIVLGRALGGAARHGDDHLADFD